MACVAQTITIKPGMDEFLCVVIRNWLRTGESISGQRQPVFAVGIYDACSILLYTLFISEYVYTRNTTVGSLHCFNCSHDSMMSGADQSQGSNGSGGGGGGSGGGDGRPPLFVMQSMQSPSERYLSSESLENDRNSTTSSTESPNSGGVIHRKVRPYCP